LTYRLGIDLGTTYTAAAIERDGRVEVSSLGTSSPVVPSVVLLRDDGDVLVGEAAARRGIDEPSRVAREFKRRLGDPAPLVLGGTPYGAEALMGHLLRRVVALVAEHEGEAPDRVVITHPANFGPYKLDMMREVARQAGLDLDRVEFLTEPQAAAISYAARNRVELGSVVAVYDFGGGTLDVALVQRTDAGFSLIGRPEGMERFGGIDIDAAILARVDEMLDGAVRQLDRDDPAVQAAVARLRDACRDAKEGLSSDTQAVIPVSLPGVQTSVRITRRELEDMVRPRLTETVEALDRAVRSAGLTMDRVSRVLLVGGSSRMPAVAEAIQRETGRPVAVDAHPKLAIATGAAGLFAFNAAQPAAAPPIAPLVAVPPPAGASPPAAVAPAAPPPPPVPPSPFPPSTVPPSTVPPAARAAETGAFQPTMPSAVPSAPKRTGLLVGVAAAIAVVLVVVGFFVFGGGDDDADARDRPDDTEEEVDTTDPPRSTDPPDTAAPPVEVAPTAAPADTAGAPAPLTVEQLRGALVTSAEIGGGWVDGVVIPDDSSAFCGQAIAEPVSEAEVVFNRTVDGQAQQLFVAASSYPDTPTAQSTFQTFRDVLRSCTSTEISDASGATATVFVQAFDETPQAGCQAALSARLDAFSVDGLALLSRLFVLQVCGNQAASASVDIPAIEGAFSPDLVGQANLALQTTVNKLLALPVVP
jgi:actin-like ATPase involved in cell morphogenesis